MPVCPKPNCNGAMFLEDKVLFCDECGYVADRNYQSRPVGRPRFSRKRRLEVEAMAARWMPGKVVSHKPAGLKSTIVISKHGTLYYRNAGHVHKHLKQRAIA